MSKNIEGILKYAADKRKDTEKKVNAAINKLKLSNKKITFKAVSKESGISATTLYNNAVLKERIKSLRDFRTVENDSVKGITKDNDVIRTLRNENKKLKEEKQMLVLQLLELEQLKHENERLKKLLSPIKRE